MVEKENLNLFLDLAQKQYLEEENRRDVFDRKASMSIGFTGVLAGVVYFSFQNFSQVPLSLQPCFAIMGIIVSLLVSYSFIASVRVLVLTEYISLPDPKVLYEDYLNVDPIQVKAQLISAFTEAFETNKKINDNKAQKLQFSLWSNIAVAIIFMLSALCIALSGG